MPRETPTSRPPRAALAHYMGGSPDVYRLTSIDMPEVTSGTVTTDVRCDACGQSVSCIVESPQARIRHLRRGRRRTFYGTLALATPAAMSLALLIEPTNLEGAIALAIAVAITCVIVGSAIRSASADLDRPHDGEEGVRLPRRRRPHSIRYRQDLSEDKNGNWHSHNVVGGVRDCNAEPLILGPL